MKIKSKLIAALLLGGASQAPEAGFLDDIVKFTADQSQKILAEPVIKNMEKQHKFKSGLVKYNADDDMPPEEHRDMWGLVESKHGKCWYHVKTYKKICEENQ
ncbi:hypothetical protein [Methylomonas methanica]|uniref:Uncharacterized protein n=1 Tax=Methylomonas methanica (strain DSM 25384 / MC09) TaxID=857087 RepID=F9ZVC2_METMM|nr:hypothetical protein [Methylomonas methanica]AEG00732.1 hypothetical protein Metme_2330 [Methylomonas methanica MC09]